MWENFIFLIVNAAIPAYMYYSCPTHINLDPSSQKNEIEKCGNSFINLIVNLAIPAYTTAAPLTEKYHIK